MQRALFLAEGSGERIAALINPERLEFTRVGGLRPQRHATGIITGPALSDDPLIQTGGGVTELELELLFDVTLVEALGGAPSGADLAASARPADVRELTRPLWALSENTVADNRRSVAPRVRFIWGRSWNVLGVIVAIAERFEQFDHEGRPGRSLLKLRLRRVGQATGAEAQGAASAPATTPFFEPAEARGDEPERIAIVADEGGLPNVRLDLLAARVCGDPAQWLRIAEANNIDDPLRIPSGTVLEMPGRGFGEKA
jgi:hypothetical protein